MKLLSFYHGFTSVALAAGLGLLLGACDPAETSNTPPPPPPPPPKYTLENVCEKAAADQCAMRESCCAQAGGYDATGCINNAIAECNANVADVNAGIMTFDGEAVDECIAALQPYSDKCYLTVNDYFTAPVDLEPCTRLWQGQLAEGATCERTEQCKSSLSDRELVQCNDMTKKCTTFKFLPLGTACVIQQDPRELCDAGLYCAFDFLTMKGVCKEQTALGSPCTPGIANLECGLGNVCDTTTLKCVEGKNEGEPCQTALDCKSVTCKGNVCVKPPPLFNQQQCTGMP